MLISEAYRELNRQKLQDSSGFGMLGGDQVTHPAPAQMHRLCLAYGFGSLLDYGCGQGLLKQRLPAERHYEVAEYDPAVFGKDAPPEPADVVYCGDVLEHIEPECLNAVLDDIKRVTRKYAVLIVATVPAKKHLADGRNTHLIVEPVWWWLPKIAERFTIHKFQGEARYFVVACLPKVKRIADEVA